MERLWVHSLNWDLTISFLWEACVLTYVIPTNAKELVLHLWMNLKLFGKKFQVQQFSHSLHRDSNLLSRSEFIMSWLLLVFMSLYLIWNHSSHCLLRFKILRVQVSLLRFIWWCLMIRFELSIFGQEYNRLFSVTAFKEVVRKSGDLTFNSQKGLWIWCFWGPTRLHLVMLEGHMVLGI